MIGQKSKESTFIYICQYGHPFLDEDQATVIMYYILPNKLDYFYLYILQHK